MTLIATTTNFGSPLLIGDILISTQMEDRKISIPTFVRSVSEEVSKTSSILPYSLRRKIHIVKDKIAIGFSGSVVDINSFYSDIKLYFRFNEVSHEAIMDFLSNYDFSGFISFGFLMLYPDLLEGKVIIRTLRMGPFTSQTSREFEEIVAIGSGAKSFLHFAESVEMNYGSEPVDLTLRGIRRNFRNILNFLNKERFTLSTIKEGWGAGFEMIFYNGEKFEMVEDITYFIWTGELDLQSNEKKIAPAHYLNYKYYNGILLITASDGKTVERYAVPPIDMNVDEIDLGIFPPQPDFQSTNKCCIFNINTKDGYLETPYLFVEDNTEPQWISFNINAEGLLAFNIRVDVENMIFEAIKNKRGEIKH